MSTGFFNVPVAVNEPVKTYAPGTAEREEVQKTFKEMYQSTVDIPLYIGGKEIRTGVTKNLFPPFDHQHHLGVYHIATKDLIQDAIDSALQARVKWSQMAWEHRASIFLKAAELIAGPYRAKINAATMIAQGKMIHQADIEAACKYIYIYRYIVQYKTENYKPLPISSKAIQKRVEQRP